MSNIDPQNEQPVRKRFTYVEADDEFGDLESADDAPELEVELGGKVYVATCPNALDFVRLQKQFREVRIQPGKVDMYSIVSAFFDPDDSEEIDFHTRGGKHAKIKVNELLSGIKWLIDEYEGYVGEDFKSANRETRRAKKSPARQPGGRRR